MRGPQAFCLCDSRTYPAAAMSQRVPTVAAPLAALLPEPEGQQGLLSRVLAQLHPLP